MIHVKTSDHHLFFSLLKYILASQDGTLFQVKAVYTYVPVHDDEISVKPNDIINVIRIVN